MVKMRIKQRFIQNLLMLRAIPGEGIIVTTTDGVKKNVAPNSGEAPTCCVAGLSFLVRRIGYDTPPRALARALHLGTSPLFGFSHSPGLVPR
jgi:hypothetical protein